MLHATTCFDKRFTHLQKYDNDNFVLHKQMHRQNWFKLTGHIFFFSKIHTNLWVWLWLSGEGKSQWGGQHEFNSHRPAQGAETLCCPFVILCGTEPVSALTIILLYCSTLNIFFLNFFNGNVAPTELYVSLNMKMWLPFFEAIGVRSWARTSGAWAWI